MERALSSVMHAVHRPRLHKPFDRDADTKGPRCVGISSPRLYPRSNLINSTGRTWVRWFDSRSACSVCLLSSTHYIVSGTIDLHLKIMQLNHMTFDTGCDPNVIRRSALP